MDELLIKNWNDRVKHGDSVYHLGDFAFCKRSRVEEVFKRLNGQKFLIRGNHDKKTYGDWEWAKDVHRLKIDGIRIWLSHYSHRIWPEKHYGNWHLFGHSHGHSKPHGKSFDVGVDCWGMCPISLDEVKWVMDKLTPDHKHHDGQIWNGLEL